MSRFLAAAAVAAVCVSACSSPPSAPTPQPAAPNDVIEVEPSAPAVLVGAGDIGKCGLPGAEKTARLLDAIAGTVFAVGDIAYPSGRIEDFRDCYHPSWGRHLDRTRPAPGNHEYETANAAPYFSYFGANAGPPGLGYYSYELGTWHVVSLNSEVDYRKGGRQDSWLRADIQSHPARCTVAYFHRPRFSSGPHGNNGDVQDLWSTLHELGVDLVISGHDHLYERFAPMDAAGRADPRGLRQFVVGTGGAQMYGVASLQPNSEAQGTDLGVLKLTLFGTAYAWQFVPADGGTFTDTGRTSCH